MKTLPTRTLLGVLLLLATTATWSAGPETDAEIKRVEAALRRIDLAQQSLYQQFQMVQELRRNEMNLPDPAAPPAYGVAPPPGNYVELQRQRELREQRSQALAEELNRLYQRYQELEEQKQPLLDRLNELAR